MQRHALKVLDGALKAIALSVGVWGYIASMYCMICAYIVRCCHIWLVKVVSRSSGVGVCNPGKPLQCCPPRALRDTLYIESARAYFG